MPGIAGIIGRGPSGEKQPALDLMLKCMLHEPAYRWGHFLPEKSGLAAGWVCHPGSFSDCQPIWNERRDVCLLFAGEHYADNGAWEQIKSAAPRGAADDASGLVRLYEAHGMRFFEMLNGTFSGVLLDLREEKIFLFNDRHGLNRVYYHEGAGRLFFSSEAKSLLKVLPQTRQFDEQSLGEWLSCGCALQNRSLFRGISLLPPASVWIFSRDGKVKKQTYFDSSAWESQPALSPAEFSDQLEHTFPRVLMRYTKGSQPLGMSLTGGLDGRMIMAWARPDRGQLPCYTFNGSYRECADLRLARRIAAACGQPHETITVGHQFLEQFPQLAEQSVYITDGAMDVTGAVELYVNRLARHIAPVRLTGNYGSEILRRHVAFKPRALPPEMLAPDFSPRVAAAVRAYSEASAGNRLSFIAAKQVPWHHYARFAIEQSQITMRSPFLDNDLVALAYQAPPLLAASLKPSLQLIAQGNPLLGRIPTDRGITFPADRMSNRVHRSLQEFLAKAEYAYDYGMPDWLARMDHCLAPFRLEKLFLGRQKFYHFRTWYRHQLAPFVRQVLLDPRSRSRFWVNRPWLERMVQAHLRGAANHTLAIHKLLSLELLQRVLLESA